MADEGTPDETQQWSGSFLLTASQQTLHAAAAPAFESSLCFTYNTQADANLCNCTHVRLSHPRHGIATPTHHKPFYVLQWLGQSGLVSSSPHRRQQGSTGTIFAGDERVKDWLQTHPPDCFEDREENKCSLKNGLPIHLLFAKWPLPERS